MIRVLIKIFSPDEAGENYNVMLKNYRKTDGLLAISLFIIQLILFYITGLVLIHYNLYLGVPCTLIVIALMFVLIRTRQQSIKSVGITKTNLPGSSFIGFILSIPFFILGVLPKLSALARPILPVDIIYSVFFYLVVISFSEEVFFRGYIQTRLHGLIKYKWPAIFAGGVMFSVMHVPFQAALYYYQTGMPWSDWIEPSRLLVLVGMHVALNLLYRKYNSLAGPVILHFFVNFTITPAVFFM